MKKEKVCENPKLWTGLPMHHCPGCHYGIVIRLLAESLDELGIAGKTIGIAPVGCSLGTPAHLNIDFVGALHGRAPSVATGVKQAHYGKPIVFTIQGDGDLAAIGMGEIINAAIRFDKLTTIFLNNANFGTTGGQLAPTTLLGQITPTTPQGRAPESEGFPVHMAELMAGMKGVAYSFRGAVNSIKNFNQTKRAIRTAFQKQIDGIGYGFVEILSPCPPNWKMRPVDALRWIEEKMIKEYPLGEFKNVDGIIS